MAYTTSRSRILAAAALPVDRDRRVRSFPGTTGPARGANPWRFLATDDPVRGVRLAVAVGPPATDGGAALVPRASPPGGLDPELLVCGASAHLGHGPAVHVAIRLRSGHARGLSPDRERDLRTSDHRRGWLATPETAPATKGTSQLLLGETLAAGSESLGLAAFRCRTLRAGDHEQLLELHREMPIGWPEAEHPERAEAAITGRTALFQPGDTLHVAIPSWRTDEEWFVGFSLWGLPEAVAAVKAEVGVE